VIAQIIFPPQFEPFQPYLSGPYLKGLLGRYGIESRVFDANVDFFNWLVERQHVIQPSRHDHYLADQAGDALATLRRIPSDLPRYRWAINVLDRYLEMAGQPSGRLGLTRFEIDDRYNSEALRLWAQSDGLFRAYFAFAQERFAGEGDTPCYLLSLVVMDQLGPAVVLAQEIRKCWPKARILVGGPLVSRLHRQLTATPWLRDLFDAIVAGEAYSSLPVLFGLRHMEAYSGHVTPVFDDCDWGAYWSCRRVLPYLVAHGCKWGKCTFCSHHLTYDGYRTSGMTRVLEDLEYLAGAHDIEYVSFCDEYLTPSQLTELAEGIVERGLVLAWSTFARPEPAFKDAAWIQRLYAGGCRMLMFGLESGSQRVVSAMRKGTRVANFRPILECCEAAGIAIRYDFMVGFPGETREDVQASYDFIRDNRDVIDTPFSSYSVAAFELRSGVPVEQDRQKYGIAGAGRLRGDLDDQYEYEVTAGLSEAERANWRAQFIRLGKEELAFDVICPQNKTHQLIFKDLFDRGAFPLPPTRLDCETASQLTAKFAPDVSITRQGDAVSISSLATGGAIELSGELSEAIDFLQVGGLVSDAAALQEAWDLDAFARFVSFLYRNDYVLLDEVRPSPAPGEPRRGPQVCMAN